MMIFRRFSIKKISTRLMLMFLVITTIIFSIFSFVITSLFSDKLTREINMVASQQMEFASSLLDNLINQIWDYHFSIMKDPQFQEAMTTLNQDSYKESSAELQNALEKAILDTDQDTLKVRSAFVISKEGTIMNSLYNLDSYKWLVNDNPEFDHFLDSQLTLRISAPNNFPFRNVETDPRYRNSTLTCFGQIYEKGTYNILGYLAINLNRSGLFKELDELFEGTWSQFYIVDENQNVIYSNPLNPECTPELTELFLVDYPQLGKQVFLDNRSYIGYSTQVSHYANWRILGFIDYQNIYQPLHNIFKTLILVYFILIFFACIIHYYLAQHITIPIRALNKAMHTIRKGEWPDPIPVTQEDEMSETLEGFNKMNLSLQRMTAQIAAQQEETRKNEVALIQSQLDLLESQINPHFIHNTLNTMKYLARLARADRLESLITSFNALLRTSMSTDKLMIPLNEEVENLYHYMDIQKERYDFPIDFQCDIPADASDVLLPKLILQPLVENSLFHGIAPHDGGRIRVKARVADGRLWVIVWDDGAGISESQLTRLEERLKPSAKGYSRIGISNVNTRLILSYGASSHLVIESLPNKKTSFSFSIPV